MNPRQPKPIDVIHKLMRTSNFIKTEFQSQLSALNTPYHLSGPKLRLLSIVADAGQIRMNELAVKLKIKARTVTDFIDALEQDKLLIRIPDPTDRRATLIQLTELAQSNIKQALTYQDKIADNMLDNLSIEQQKQLFDLLSQITNNKDMSLCEEPAK